MVHPVALPLRGQAASAPTPTRRFVVSVRNADGTRLERIHIGGCAMDHAIAAIDDAGAGARIVVKLLSSGTAS